MEYTSGRIKMVVFDMAGTTVQDNKDVESCFAEACKQMQLDVSDERILALQGYSKIEVFKILWQEKVTASHPRFDDLVGESYACFKNILENHYHTSTIEPTEGCLETFRFLRDRNIKIALTTGFYRVVTDIILRKLGWMEGLDEQRVNTFGRSIIDVSVASDEVEKGRPEPFMIAKAMKAMKLNDARSVINIGDTPVDLQSGERAGCVRNYAVTNGTHTEQQLEIYKNDALLSSLHELPLYVIQLEDLQTL